MRRIAITFVLTLAATPAAAQTFPPDDQWVPLHCRGEVMSDLFMDESGALDERDIVGDDVAPAGLHAIDDTYLYLRLRLEDDPAGGGNLRPFVWGFELDVDADLTTYEALVVVNGLDNEVALYANSVTTLPDDPNDPADEPAIAAYPSGTHARTLVAAGSSYGGSADTFLDMAIPWTDLAQAGVTPATVVTAWAASSSSKTSLNGDFACHDGASGEPTLSDTASDPTTADPAGQDTDGDGYTDATEDGAGTDPLDPDSHPAGPPDAPLLEGGGGCSTGGGRSTLWIAVAALLLRRRRLR